MVDILKSINEKEVHPFREHENIQHPDEKEVHPFRDHENIQHPGEKDELLSNDKYIITLNGKPQFFLPNYEDSIEEMWNLARKLQFEQHSYNCIIHNPVNGFQDKLHIIGRCNIFLIQYDKILYELEVHKVEGFFFKDLLSQ